MDEGEGVSDVEADSDHEDQYAEMQLGNWLGQLEALKQGLDAGGTGTVKRRTKTVVTPKMAMESFRFSFVNSDENQDVNLDAILGELCELESQLNTTQSELSARTDVNRGVTSSIAKDDNRDSGNDFVQAELDALAAEISRGIQFQDDYCAGLDQSYLDPAFDIGESDSAFSDNTSLPSSESFTSMVTVSSSADTSSSGDSCSTNSTSTLTPNVNPILEEHAKLREQLSIFRRQLKGDNLSPEDQKSRIKAEKIRIALEKIKEAKIRKLFVRAFSPDGSSKSILVDEKMSVSQVCCMLADKNHVRLTTSLAVIEQLPELFMERILEDHDSLVENMVMWSRDSKNKILFEEHPSKSDLFKSPEKYLLVGSSSEKGASLDPMQRQNLIQEFFMSTGVQLPEVEGVLHLKTEGKKAWKKFYFVLRSSGIYYNPKGKISKASKDLICLVQLDFVEVYHGINWKKKFHSPSDYTFALKHPQIQKKSSKYIHYICAENKASLDLWVMGIRIAKYGKQLLLNHSHLCQEITAWDARETVTSPSAVFDEDEERQFEFNYDHSLQDSRMSVTEPGIRHTIVKVKNSTLVRKSSMSANHGCENPNEVVCLEVTPLPQKSVVASQTIAVDSPPKTPIKRVSFSNTHCIINTDPSEELAQLRHRDSITSASTDSSEESNSSGEGRVSMTSLRGKMKPKLPVTTETTRQISEMCQLTIETSSVVSGDMIMEDQKLLASQICAGQNERIIERRKSAPSISGPRDSFRERRGSDRSVSSVGSADSMLETRGSENNAPPSTGIPPRPSVIAASGDTVPIMQHSQPSNACSMPSHHKANTLPLQSTQKPPQGQQTKHGSLTKGNKPVHDRQSQGPGHLSSPSITDHAVPTSPQNTQSGPVYGHVRAASQPNMTIPPPPMVTMKMGHNHQLPLSPQKVAAPFMSPIPLSGPSAHKPEGYSTAPGPLTPKPEPHMSPKPSATKTEVHHGPPSSPKPEVYIMAPSSYVQKPTQPCPPQVAEKPTRKVAAPGLASPNKVPSPVLTNVPCQKDTNEISPEMPKPPTPMGVPPPVPLAAVVSTNTPTQSRKAKRPVDPQSPTTPLPFLDELSKKSHMKHGPEDVKNNSGKMSHPHAASQKPHMQAQNSGRNAKQTINIKPSVCADPNANAGTQHGQGHDTKQLPRGKQSSHIHNHGPPNGPKVSSGGSHEILPKSPRPGSHGGSHEILPKSESGGSHEILPKSPRPGSHKVKAPTVNNNQNANKHATSNSVMTRPMSAGKPSTPSAKAKSKSSMPPPTPKRSESTRLSSEMPKPVLKASAPDAAESLYENVTDYDSLLDASDLPPPPPELLEGLETSTDNGVTRKSKPPPPLPKRNKETQLSRPH